MEMGLCIFQDTLLNQNIKERAQKVAEQNSKGLHVRTDVRMILTKSKQRQHLLLTLSEPSLQSWVECAETVLGGGSKSASP